MSLALAKIGTGKAGPHSSGKGQRISTVRDFRFFLMPWRDKSKDPSHVSLHRTEAKGSLFSVFGFISREKTRNAFIQLGGNRPLPCHFLDQCFYALLRTKKTWMDAFHIKMRHSLKQCKFVIYLFPSVKTVP